ncbi:MAG: hypothetical protein WA021_01125 [Minisyncoccia bacterium]
MTTTSYTPSDELTKAVLAAFVAPIPYVVGVVVRAIPDKAKLWAVSKALEQVVPLSLGSYVLTQRKDARITLTKHGQLKEEVQQSLLKRIASWFVPEEVSAVSLALQKEVTSMANGGYVTDAFHLEMENGEVVLVVRDTSFIRGSADTVIDLLGKSSDSVLRPLVELIKKCAPKS